MVGDANAAFVSLDDSVDNSQAKAGTVGLAARDVDPGKWPEQACDVFLRNTNSVISHTDQNTLFFFFVFFLFFNPLFK